MSFCFRGKFGFLNCDDNGLCVVNKQFEPLEFISNYIYVGLKYNDNSLTFATESACYDCLCSHVVVIGMSVRLSWYPVWCVRWFQ